MSSRLLVCTLVMTCVAGCASKTEEFSTSTTTTPSTPATASTAAPEPDLPPAPQRTAGAPLVFTAQDGWREEQPKSGMRKAQYLLPRTAGDDRDATLIVYYFGKGQGGSLEANVERWAGQLTQPDGSNSLDRMVRAERRVHGMPVHEFDLTGTYVAETSPGSGERVNQPNTRMLAAIVESDHGPYYAKLIGPEATVGHWAPGFRKFLGGIR